MASDRPIHDVVHKALTDLGLAPASPLIRTILIHDGCFLGQKFRYDSGYAVWLEDKKVIDVYDESGTLVKTVTPSAADRESAA
jgi:hypothetical protein